MATPKITDNLNLVQTLDDQPNATSGFTPSMVKAKFDEAVNKIKDYINNILTVAFDTHLADLVTDADGAHGLKIESGSWTPNFLGATTAGVFTYSNQVGKYTKIGKLVKVTFNVTVTAVTTPGAGFFQIAGLPFAVNASLSERGSGSASEITNISLTSGCTQYGIRTGPSNTVLYVTELGSGRTVAIIDASKIVNGTSTSGCAIYETN